MVSGKPEYGRREFVFSVGIILGNNRVLLVELKLRIFIFKDTEKAPAMFPGSMGAWQGKTWLEKINRTNQRQAMCVGRNF